MTVVSIGVVVVVVVLSNSIGGCVVSTFPPSKTRASAGAHQTCFLRKRQSDPKVFLDVLRVFRGVMTNG
jgi:hypothetical protein